MYYHYQCVRRGTEMTEKVQLDPEAEIDDYLLQYPDEITPMESTPGGKSPFLLRPTLRCWFSRIHLSLIPFQFLHSWRLTPRGFGRLPFFLFNIATG